MTTGTKFFATCLSAWLFALSGSMTLLLALVGTASERTSANLATAYLSQPTWLVLEDTLATQTRLGC